MYSLNGSKLHQVLHLQLHQIVLANPHGHLSMVTIREGYPENCFGPNFAQILI